MQQKISLEDLIPLGQVEKLVAINNHLKDLLTPFQMEKRNQTDKNVDSSKCK